LPGIFFYIPTPSVFTPILQNHQEVPPMIFRRHIVFLLSLFLLAPFTSVPADVLVSESFPALT
jgi:hypothetical protein